MTAPLYNDIGKLTRKARVACSLVIEQRQFSVHGSYASIMGLIAATLLTTLNLSTHHGTQYFSITASSEVQRLALVTYLDTYPLLSSKYLDYLA